jgi:hypothetical protein
VNTLDGRARVKLWWIRSDGCRGFKRHGGLAHRRVLVECKKLPVRDNLDLFRGEIRKLHMRPMIAFSEVSSKGTNERTTHISAKQDGTLHKRPHRKVCAFLLGRQVAVAVADFHHIHVVVREEVNGGQVLNVFLDDRLYVLPGRADIGTGSLQDQPGSDDDATHLESPDMRQE